MEIILLARISQIVLIVFSGSSFEVFIGVKILTVVLVFKVLVFGRFLESVSKTSTFWKLNLISDINSVVLEK